MSKTTRATQTLERLGVKFTLHAYDYDPDAESIGLQAADARRRAGPRAQDADGRGRRQAGLRRGAVGLRSQHEEARQRLRRQGCQMMRPADAERLTGYHVGGISPFGQKKRVPVAIEAAALGHASVFLNGGQRGLQVELDPNDAVKAAGAIARPLTA